MPTVVPLLVTIGLRPGGREADHPNWALVPLPPAIGRLSGDGTRPEDFTLGSWHYDKASGHDDDEPGVSPLNTQRGVRLVTPAFAANAVATFGGQPYNMAIMTEAAWATFYDTRVRGHMPEHQVNTEILQALQAELSLRIDAAPGPALVALRAKIVKALDPDDPEPGIRRDPLRKWADAKAKMNVVIPP